MTQSTVMRAGHTPVTRVFLWPGNLVGQVTGLDYGNSNFEMDFDYGIIHKLCLQNFRIILSPSPLVVI